MCYIKKVMFFSVPKFFSNVCVVNILLRYPENHVQWNRCSPPSPATPASSERMCVDSTLPCSRESDGAVSLDVSSVSPSSSHGCSCFLALNRRLFFIYLAVMFFLALYLFSSLVVSSYASEVCLRGWHEELSPSGGHIHVETENFNSNKISSHIRKC